MEKVFPPLVAAACRISCKFFVVFVLLLSFVRTGWGQTTYTWNQTGSASWAVDVNWTPARTTPAATDILVFNNGAITTATNVPAQTIGSLQISSGTKLTLNTSGVTATLTINNGVTGADLTVESGCQLNIAQVTAANAMTISLVAGATGSISGSMDFSSTTASTPNQFLGADASAITFNSGAVFTQNTNSTGSVFGTSGTANTIIFSSGTSFIQNAGSNPFGLGQPASKVVFQAGSLYKHQHTGAPSFSGRTYADFELNVSGSISPNGGNAVSINNMTVTQGTLNFNMTGTPGHAIKGNITVQSGATLNFNPASAGTLNFNGSSIQTIGNSGTLTSSTNQTFVLFNSTNTIFSQNGSGIFTLAGIISSAAPPTPINITGAGSGFVGITNLGNTYTGTISITGSEARFSDNGCFGNANNTIVIDGGKLATTAVTTYTIASTHNIQVSNVAGSAISVTTGGTLTYNGVIADKPSTTGTFVKQGAGLLFLGGASTYTGSTIINRGLVKLTSGNDRLPISSVLYLGEAATETTGVLDINGFNQTFSGINSITGNATTNEFVNAVISAGGAATLTVNGSGNYSFGDGTTANSGFINSTVSIVKNGSGTQTFGDANNYSGTTTVTQGALIINGAQTGTGAVTVASGAILGGSGTLPGTASLTGTVSPGSSPGTFNTGAFTFNANSTFKFEISDATGSAGTDWDKLVSSGTIDVTASPITIDLTSLSIVNFNNALPYTWEFAQGTSIVGFNAGNFIINTTNFLPPLGGGSFSVAQTGNSLNIVFTTTGSPGLTSPTAASITEMDAILGATLAADGGSTVTERGTVYKLSAGVTASDNPLAEGGTSLGVFSHQRTGLNAETQYFYAGYAINSSGTGLSPESNFRTLSNSPTSEAGNFTSTPFSSTQIDLSWSSASFPGSGATANGYIILRRQDMSNPTTTGIVDAVAPGSLSLPAGTILVTTITSGSTIAYSNTGLDVATQYNYLIVPFTWDGTNAVTYNYYLANAPAANATTLAGTPIVTSPTVANITDISAELGANVTSNGGSALTERGTVYKTSSGVTITDNPLAEGGTSTGVYSHVRNGLSPETQYFFKGYAINPNGSGLSSEGNFYTWSAPPVSEVTNFAAVPFSVSEIDLSWTAATFPGAGATATGYLILRRSDMSNPTTTGFVNGSDPASLTFPAGTTLVTTITSGSTVMYNNMGLSPNSQYNYLIVPFTWDNVHAATYNYYLTNAATAFATTLPAPPALNNPTVTGVTESSAVLGANVTTNNGSALTERGTVYKTSSPVAATDNPLAEGGTATGVFSHTRSGLSPQMQYFFAGYAINSGGTGMSTEGNFRTLSNPPLSEVTNFTATPFSNSQIDLAWTAANFPMSGATNNGYLIILKIGSNPTTSGIVNAVAPGALNFPNETQFVVAIASGATVMYSNSGLAGSTQYNYLIVPFTWDGTNATTYNYYLPNAATANATTQQSPPIVWTNTGTSTAWYTSTNWTPNTTSGQWTPNDVSQFKNSGTANSAGINLNTANLTIGAIEVTADRTTNNLTIGNSSTTVSGILTLNGISVNGFSNTILRNGSIKNLILQNNLSGSQTMDIALGNATNNMIYLDGAGNITISNIITGTSKILSLNGAGAGSLTLSGANTFSGGFILNAGTVTPTVTGAFGTGTLTCNGGTVNTTANLSFTNAIAIGGTMGLSGTLTTTFSGTADLGAASRTITNSLTSGSRIFSGIISGATGSGITFNGTGSGIIYISGTNTFTGDININGGEVGFPNNNAFGNAVNTIILDGGRITSSTTAAGSITATWPSSHAIQVGTNGGSINVVGAPGDLSYDGVIANKPSATGALIKQGAGILRLGGASTYTGTTTINNGTLQLTTATNRLPVTTTLNFGQTSSPNLGTLDMNNLSQEVAGINSITGTNGTVSNNLIVTGLATTLTLSGSGTYSFGDGTNANSGVIEGAVSILKNGSGTQSFGDANTYTGTTTVNQGVLNINGTHTGNGAITIASGATLGGSGTIPGTVSNSGIVSPGTSPGTINTGSFTFNANSTFNFEINNATGTAGTHWDKLISSGAIDVTASPINIDLYSLSIMNFDNTLPYTWTFASGTSIVGFNASNFVINATNFLPPLGGGAFSVSNTGNDLNIIFTPTLGPILTLPTAVSITNTDAILGATIINDNGSAVTARGTVYKLSPGVTAIDNPLVEGGTGLGAYSHLRSGLSPETQYYYAGYATNSAATTLSPESNFRTLSNPPTSEATGFSATAVSASQINLAWTVATFPMSGATANGYIILRREDMSDPTTTGIVNATAPASLTLPVGTTLVATITSGSTAAYSNMGLAGLTQYNYLIVPFTWDGSHDVTYNYYLPNAPAANATTLPNVPALNNPTATSITENTADLGATVVTNNGSALTERGTVYKTSSPVTAADNALAEGGTAVGTYSHTRNSLLPQTQYFFAGYAINGGGTGLSNEGNFRTLSNSPTSEATNFTATSFSAYQIDLAWTTATFPMSGASGSGYIILRKNGSDPNTDGVVDATAPGALTLPGGTTLVTTIISGATTNYSNTGLSAGTQYNYLIIPFTWDGANTVTYNYYLLNAPAANATTKYEKQTFAGDGFPLNSGKWSVPSVTSCDLNNMTNSFGTGSIANFCTVAGTGAGASIVISEINATEDFTLLSTSGTISNVNNGIAPIEIASGKTVDFSIQDFAVGTSAGYIKNGLGALATSGGTYSGGFTLNAGTVIARGVNAMGGALGPLNLNGGIVAASANTTFNNKFSVINIGGDIQFGSITSPASGAAILTFTGNPISLGSALHTLTMGGSGNIVLNAVISNTGTNGIAFNANVNGTGRFDIQNAGNTFTGPINILGNGTTGAEVRFSNAGSFGNVNNTININGGRLSNAAAMTLASTHLIQLGNTAGSAISTNTGNLTFNGVIADLPTSTPGALVKQGTTILILGGVSTYTGSTTVNSGTLGLTNGNDRLPIGTTIYIGQAASTNLGTFNLGGTNQQVAGVNSITGTNATASNNTITSVSPAILTISGNGTYAFGDGSNGNSGVIGGAISLVKTGTGTQTLGDANTYTGSTTITNGELRFNPSANTVLAGACVMNGGILGTTGIADTRTLTFASFDLSENSKIDLSSLVDHSITFTIAGTFTPGKTLTIYGWVGSPGVSGLKGKIFFGNSSSALTPTQLAQIQFNDGTINTPGNNYPATILPSGEIVGCGSIVINTNDAGAGSLRDVISCVASGSTITFDASLTGSTITLTSGQIEIDKSLTINGLGNVADLVLSGNNASRIFHVASGKTLTLQNLSLKNANAVAPHGGALFIEGSLTLQNILLQNNFENGVTPKAITVNSVGGVVTVIGGNVEIRE